MLRTRTRTVFQPDMAMAKIEVVLPNHVAAFQAVAPRDDILATL